MLPCEALSDYDNRQDKPGRVKQASTLKYMTKDVTARRREFPDLAVQLHKKKAYVTMRSTVCCKKPNQWEPRLTGRNHVARKIKTCWTTKKLGHRTKSRASPEEGSFASSPEKEEAVQEFGGSERNKAEKYSGKSCDVAILAEMTNRYCIWYCTDIWIRSQVALPVSGINFLCTIMFTYY